MQLSFLPLSKATWDAFTGLFGEKGACGGCWCMNWRLNSKTFEQQKGAGNKKALRALAKKNEPLGMIAFADRIPAGWCAIAPRKAYARLATSRILKPVDNADVWSVSCFFIAKEYRNKGLSVKLLRTAVAYAFANGASIVEGYPVEPKKDKMPDVFAWTGLYTTFIKAGFTEVARRSETRPIMRTSKTVR